MTTATSPATTADDSGGNSTGAGVGCPAAYEDFDDGEIDPAFDQAHPTELQEVGGELVMTITPRTGDSPGLRYSDGELTNVQATIELGMVPDSAYTQITLAAYRPDDKHHYMAIQQSAIALRAGVAGRDEELALIPFSPIVHRWLRLEFEDPWVRYQNSADGVAWETMLEVESAWAYDAGSRLELLATNWETLAGPEQVSIRQYDICLLR